LPIGWGKWLRGGSQKPPSRRIVNRGLYLQAGLIQRPGEISARNRGRALGQR
jgi:hypothetical protein